VIATPVVAWVGGIVVASGVFGWCAPAVARRASARAATWLLSVGSLLVAGSVLIVPALLALVAVGQVPMLAGIGDWSARRLARFFPLHNDLVAVPVAVLVAQLWVLMVAAARQAHGLRQAWRTSRDFDTPLIVLPGSDMLAFALPGWPGRVVASRGLLQFLNDRERKAVLAHEQAHLDHHHDLHTSAAVLAAAVSPLLRTVPAAICLASERWADESAAVAVGDRGLVAATIGRVAKAGSIPASLIPSVMGVSDSDVAVRVTALVEKMTARRWWWEALLALVVTVAVGLALCGLYDTKHIFEVAEISKAHLHR
jgi:Zn-dependent protease with chaperone function